jgi:hypothetical protein
MMRHSIGAIIALTVITASCGSGSSVQKTITAAQTPASSTGGSAPEPILGTWQTEYTCEKFAQALEREGVGELAAKFLVALRMQQGPVDRLANSAGLCADAKDIQRTQVFQPNGYLIHYRGTKIVDDCQCYQLIGRHTFVVLGDPGDPDIPLQYRIDGETLTFDAVMPDQCSSANCRDQFALAVSLYAVGAWQRVDS